jgi:hypothetical protein
MTALEGCSVFDSRTSYQDTSRSDRIVDAAKHVGNRVITFERMPQRAIGVDVIPISPTDTLANQIAGLLEFLQDPLHGTLRDPDQLADVTLAQLRIPTDGDQDVGVVREKRPPRTRRTR